MKFKVKNSLLIIFIVLTACKSVKYDKNKCSCESIVKSYVLLNFRYENKDTLIGPKMLWNDGSFDENEDINLIKTCTNLDISYTPVKWSKRGYYLFGKQHLNYVESWLQTNCKKESKEMEKYKAPYIGKKYIHKDSLLINEAR